MHSFKHIWKSVSSISRPLAAVALGTAAAGGMAAASASCTESLPVPMPSSHRRMLLNHIETFIDFPKKGEPSAATLQAFAQRSAGIVFQCVFPIFRDPALVDQMVTMFADEIKTKYGHVDAIVGMVRAVAF